MTVVLITGSTGIIGQHMARIWWGPYKVCMPSREVMDINDLEKTAVYLDALHPEIIINLAGESRVDVVENNPDAYFTVNVEAPEVMAHWAQDNDAHFIQVSTQGVFSGENPPYGPNSKPDPITQYGIQKAEAERRVGLCENSTIVRMTFVLGVRPDVSRGRTNPLEDIYGGNGLTQVDDHFFSPVFATDAAQQLWDVATSQEKDKIYHVGIPVRVSRADVAEQAVPGAEVTRVSHTYFKGLAPRPVDTTWEAGALHRYTMEEGLTLTRQNWRDREGLSIEPRAQSISKYLDIPLDDAIRKLLRGFGAAHTEVAQDFNKTRPKTPEELLDWYRNTEAYIWELSAYHLDPGFNYSGMCRGIAQHLITHKAPEVLCLGDGIGDLTMTCRRYGLVPTYNDLEGGRTAGYAQSRFSVEPKVLLTPGWDPMFDGQKFDAIVAMDFFEHVVNVEEWVTACYEALNSGGWFLAQNAFAIGDPEHGDSIPMHLAENNRFEFDWDPMLVRLGFTRDGGWWRK